MLVNPIYPHGMNLSVRPLTLTSQLERVVGLGRELLAHSAAKAGDVLILTSTSGRNAVVIDMALLAREKGIKTIAITSLTYSDGVTSRHPSGKRLAELVDVVVDNGAPRGDAAVEITGFRQKVGPLSSVTGWRPGQRHCGRNRAGACPTRRDPAGVHERQSRRRRRLQRRTTSSPP